MMTMVDGMIEGVGTSMSIFGKLYDTIRENAVAQRSKDGRIRVILNNQDRKALDAIYNNEWYYKLIETGYDVDSWRIDGFELRKGDITVSAYYLPTRNLLSTSTSFTVAYKGKIIPYSKGENHIVLLTIVLAVIDETIEKCKVFKDNNIRDAYLSIIDDIRERKDEDYLCALNTRALDYM